VLIEEIIMSAILTRLLLMTAVCTLALPLAANAQAVRSTGAIRNDNTTWLPGTATLPVNATGAAIAAAQTAAGGTVNNVAAAAPARSFKVNGADAAGREVTILSGLIADALKIPSFKANGVAHRAGIRALQEEVSVCTRPDAAGATPMCTPMAGAGTFAPVAKAVGTPISSDTGAVVGMAGNTTIETATARASQTLSLRNMRTVNTPNELASASVEKGGRAAAAIAVNHDPMAVQWPSPGDRSITYDISNVSLGPLRSDLGSDAFAYFSTSTAFADNTLSLTVPERDAQLLYRLLLGISSDDGAPSVLDSFEFLVPCASTVPATCAVSDTVGGTSHNGLAAVTADLLTNFQPDATGRWRFVQPLSFTVTLPGTGSQSVLFMEDQGLAVARAPEPGSAWLLGGGLAALLLFLRSSKRTRRRARS
jgi:hypothetical protein